MQKDIGPEQQRLTDRLFNDPNRRTLNFHIFPGDFPGSAEELCCEINSSFDRIESGESKPCGPPTTGLAPMSVDDFLESIPKQRTSSEC